MNRTRYVRWPLLVAVLIVWGPFCSMAPAAADGTSQRPQPNFVVILIDDMGYGDIEPFGSN